MESWSLLQLNRFIQQQFRAMLPETYWVVAEINELHVQSAGHCYLELIEKAPQSDRIIAKAHATIWSYSFRMISPYFESATGQRLSVGMKVMLHAGVEYHELYGLSLNVTDINPAYTVGDLVLQRQAIIQQLKEEGIFNLNREIEPPQIIQHIAVISSETAAGYGDFISQLHRNPYGYAFKHTLFPAILQGNEAEKSISRAFHQIFEREKEYDAVALIRGGGSQSDLNCFNSYILAATIAQFPLPVLTGIGHDRDQTIADMVAHRMLKTPTAVAEHIIRITAEFDSTLRQLATRLKSSIGVQQLLYKLMQLEIRMKTSCIKTRDDKKMHLESLSQKLAALPAERIGSEKKHIAYLDEKLCLLNPANILKRGYSITTVNGRIIKTAHNMNSGTVIRTLLGEGVLESTVTDIHEK